MANPSDIAQGTASTPVNPTTWNIFVDRHNELGNKVVDVKDYGATGDGTDDYTEILAAHVDATANGSTILFPSNSANATYKLDTNITFNADTVVAIAPGAMLKPANGITITINGGLIADPRQIFDVSLGGTIVFAKGYVPEVFPQWWGAVGDGAVDCTDAFDAAMLAAATVGVVRVTTGTWLISSALRNWPVAGFSSMQSGITIQGNGTFSELKYTATSGFCLDLQNPDQVGSGSPVGCTIQDIHMSAPNIPDPDNGGCISVSGSMNSINNVTIDDANTATGVMCRGREVVVAATYSNDTSNDMTTTGAGASEKYAFQFTTLAVASKLFGATIKMGKTGAPAGTCHLELWSDDGGAPSKPNAKIGNSSNTITNTDLNAGAGDVYFTWKGKNKPDVVAATDYWLVLATTGYTYTDGVTEVRLRVDAGDGDTDEFATFTWGGAWANSDDGSNHNIEIHYGQPIQTRISQCSFYGSTRIGRAVWLEGQDPVCNITDSFFACKEGIVTYRAYLQATGVYIYSTDTPLYMDESWVTFDNGWLEGGSTACWFGGPRKVYRITNCIIGATAFTWESGVDLVINGAMKELYHTSTDASVTADKFKYKIFPANDGIWMGTGMSVVADVDALNGNAVKLDLQGNSAGVEFRPSSNVSSYYANLPRGTYKVTIWIKDDNQVADDCYFQVHKWVAAWTFEWDHLFTATSAYRPYTFFFVVDASQVGDIAYGKKFTLIKNEADANDIYISHAIMEYMGPDDPGRGDLHTYNSEASNADNGRATNVWFHGRQDGGECVPLAAIQVRHDGALDDIMGEMIIRVNDGNDKISGLTKVMQLNAGTVDINGTLTASGDTIVNADLVSQTYNFAADAEANDTYVITLTPAIAAYTTGMMITFTANTANTGACTVNVNGKGAVSLKMLHDQDPGNNYIEAGSVVVAIYDGANFQMIQPAAN